MPTTSLVRLETGIRRANEMVIGASFAIMDSESSEATRDQARFFQNLFTRIRDVLAEARTAYWEPGAAPDDWESFASSQAALELADAVTPTLGDAL